MDLGAYVNIEELEKIAEANDIKVPRLRGYRLMKYEVPMKLEDWCNNLDIQIVEELCTSVPFWNPTSNTYEFSAYTDYVRRKYLVYKDNKPVKVKWNKIHGWKRRVLKTTIHNELQRYKKQLEVFNKYAEREDILYIHARIGGGNWPTYYKDVVDKPWFIEKVDDAFDSTYCDIYAKIKGEKYGDKCKKCRPI